MGTVYLMENKDSRESAIRWYRYYMDIRVEALIAEYRAILVSDNEETFPSIEWAMTERASGVKEKLERKHMTGKCPDCGEEVEETPKEVPGLYCSECNELW